MKMSHHHYITNNRHIFRNEKRMMGDISFLSNNNTGNGSNIIDELTNGGVKETFIIDLIVSVIAISAYLFILQPHCVLFNVKKKRNLLKRVLKQEYERMKQENENPPKLTGGKQQIYDSDSEDEEYSAKANTVQYFIALVKERLMFLWHTTCTLFYPCMVKKDRAYLAQKYGRDVTVYFLFMQHTIYVVILCSLLALVILLPVHLTGTLPEDVGQDAPIILITSVNMRIDEPKILYIHVILAIMFIILFIVFNIVMFMWHPAVSEINYQSADEKNFCTSNLSEYHLVKLTDWNTVRPLWYRMATMGMSIARSQEELVDVNKRIYLASPFCVSIIGIPPLMNQQAFMDIIYEAARNVPLKRLNKDILKVVLIPNLKKRVQMQDKLFSLIEKLDQAELELAMKPNSSMSVNICCARDIFDGGEKFHLMCKYDAIAYYKKHIEALKEDIAKWDVLYLKSYSLSKEQERKGQTNFYTDTQSYYQSQVKSKKIKPPKSSGYGLIIFSKVKSAQKFKEFYQGPGINIKQKEEKGEPQDIVKSSPLHIPALGDMIKKKDPTSETTKLTLMNESTIELEVNNESSLQAESITVENSEIFKLQESSTIEVKKIQFEIVPPKERKIVDLFRRLDYFSMFSLRVVDTTFEPIDMNIDSIFGFQKGGLDNFIRRFLIHSIVIVIFVIVCSPLSLTSGVQSFLNLNFVKIPAKWLATLTGSFGNFALHYIPSLIVLIASLVMPAIIYFTAIFAKNLTYSVIQRAIIQRSYIYLVLSTLIMPSLLLTSFDGVLQYFKSKGVWMQTFENLFVPSSGSFFVNMLLQKGLLSNSLEFCRIPNIIIYSFTVAFSQKFWRTYFPRFARYLTPIQKLKAAEQTSLYVEYEYAYIHWIVSITLAYSVFSPIVLPCGLLYFIYKYYLDRALIIDTYDHRKDMSVFGAALGLKSDFISQYKMATLNCQLVMANCFIFIAFQCFFYASKLVSNKAFLPHTCIMAVLSFLLLLGIFKIGILAWFLRKWNIRKNNYNLGNGESEPLTPSTVSKWYEPSTTFKYIPPTSQKNQWFRQKADSSLSTLQTIEGRMVGEGEEEGIAS